MQEFLVVSKPPISRSTLHLGIVCPMANEEACAEAFVADVLSHCQGFKSVSFFAVIDKVSRDKTLELLTELAKRDPRLRVIWAPENRCVVDAYVRGYQEALAAECDWILEIDAGYSHQPSDIPLFFKEMEMGYDCVFGTRFSKSGTIKSSSLTRYCVSRLGGILSNVLLGTRLTDMTSGFELFTRDALKKVLQRGIQSKGHFFQTEIKAYCDSFYLSEVPISYQSASPSVNFRVIKDALKNLIRLFLLRIGGELRN